MPFTYDVTTDVGRVRLIINDKIEATAIYSDEEISAFLDLNEDSVKRGAAAALDSIASDQALVLKVIRTLDLSTDGASVARALREHAQRLRDEADDSDAGEGDLFDYAEMVTNAFTARERVKNQVLRNQ
jgi:hypothetical protein